MLESLIKEVNNNVFNSQLRGLLFKQKIEYRKMQQSPGRLHVNVEYCKSCDTHTWCTHHQQEKYFNTFQKLKQYLEQEFQSQVIVQGNLVPDDFVPIKSAENKYYSQKTNKYVQFPITGAFQITIDGELVFSKKKTNTWPNLIDIADKVYFKLYSTSRPRKQNEKSPTRQKKNSPTKKQQRLLSAEGDIKTQKDNRSQNNQSFLDNNDKRSTFYKSKSNYKNFTLTDHFKNYHNQDYKHPIHDSNRGSEEFFTNNQTDNDQENAPSEMGSFRNAENNQTQFLEFKKNFDAWTNSQSKIRLTELIKRRGHMKDDGVGGKKQMIIRLDSIQEESILADQNAGGSIHQGPNNLLHTAYFNNTHSTFKSRKENTHKEIMNKFNADFDELEEKFKNFQQKVENIREENRKFDDNGDKKQPTRQGMSKIMNGKTFKQAKQGNKKNSRLKKSEVKDFKQDGSSEEQDMLNNPIIFAKRKLKNIEDYINGTEEEKNQKLKKIYGEWKLFGRPYKGKNYISPYKMDLLNRIGTGQTNQKNPRKQNNRDNQDKDEDSQDDSSLMSFDAKQSRPKQGKSALNKSKMPKIPPMPPGKSTKGQSNMTQPFYPSSHDDFHEGGGKKLQKKASQINSRSFDQLRQTQNLLHRAGAGIKVNTVDRVSEMQQKHKQGWDKKGSFSNSFNHPKQKIIKNGRMLRSIEKVDGQGKIITKNNFKKLQRVNNSQKNMNRIVDRDSQSKLIRKLQSKKENDQFIGSGHSDDSGQLFKNFRSKKSQNISKSKDKLVSQNQIPKKGRQVYLNRQGSEDASPQQSYNNNQQSFENNYFKDVSSKKSKQENRNSEKEDRVKKQYEKNIGKNKIWRESRIGSKQKKLSYQNEMQRSRSKNKSKQSKSFWMNSGEITQQQRKSLIQEDREEENETSRPHKLQNTSILKQQKNLEKQKLKRIQTDGDDATEKEIVGKRKNKTYENGEKPKKIKKKETIIELKDLEKSGVGQQLLNNQSGSISEPTSNQDASGQNQNFQQGSGNEQFEKSKQTFKKSKNKFSKQDGQIEKNQSKKKGSPQINKKSKTSNQTNKQKKESNDKNEDEEEDDFASFTESKQLDQTQKQDENNEEEGNQENYKSIKKGGKKLKKIEKQKKNKNSSWVKNVSGSEPKQNDSQLEKQDEQEYESQDLIQSSSNEKKQQLKQENKNTSKKQNQSSKKGKKLRNIIDKKNQHENGGDENPNEQNHQQSEIENQTLEQGVKKVNKQKESPKKKGKKLRNINKNKNQLQNGEQDNANESDDPQKEISKQGQEQGVEDSKGQKQKKASKKKGKKQRKQQKIENQNKNEDEEENDNQNEDEDQNDENENEQEKKNQIKREEASKSQQQKVKGEVKTKEKSRLKLKSHSKAVKQQASRALLKSGQTQRLNTARSVLSRNQIIGIYDDKDSQDNENSQILVNEEEESIYEKVGDKNQQRIQKQSPNKQRIKKSENKDSENPSIVLNKQLATEGKQSKKWTQISIIQQADIQQPESPQLELFNAEESREKGLNGKGKVVFENQIVDGNVNQKEKNEVDEMDQEEFEESEEQQVVLEEIKDYQESFKSGRAPIIKQFYGQSFKQQIKLFSSLPKQSPPLKNFTSLQNLIQNLPQNSSVSQLPAHIISSNPRLFNRKSIEVEKITSNHPLPNLVKCLKILADINEFLIIRLFENPLVKITKSNALKKAFGVWLCVNYEWNCVIIDLNQILLSSEGERGELKPFYLNHSNLQLWPIVLEAALAKALKSYKLLTNLPCHKLFNILTGSNSLFFNIKQDSSKNGRILRYISDCENKNFILHAEKICKNLDELQRSEKETKIYYVLSQKLVNENEILLQIRESTRLDSQWMKLTKFVQEFKSIQILQLRLNHNFSSIKLPKPMNTNNLTIIELEYLQESFGSITLSTATGELCPILKTYLYKEEKSNVLKLVGEAKQKNKSTLFFDCFFGETRYYLFVESAVQSRVTYLGENQPLIKIIQEINSDGLKNDYTEYLPINSVSRNTQKTTNWGFKQMTLGPKMPNKLTKSRFGETGMSFKSQQDEKISRLRENFVEYLLKGTD